MKINFIRPQNPAGVTTPIILYFVGKVDGAARKVVVGESTASTLRSGVGESVMGYCPHLAGGGAPAYH
ncbi:MAG: hypothetical protein IPG38_18415 [Chitinophagaceae bacterium]|nr:hypothetical protein [Chitinophagaceae bacterium]